MDNTPNANVVNDAPKLNITIAGGEHPCPQGVSAFKIPNGAKGCADPGLRGPTEFECKFSESLTELMRWLNKSHLNNPRIVIDKDSAKVIYDSVQETVYLR